MKPSIGRIVIIKGIQSNGADEHPAIITRVWSDMDPADGAPVCVNLTVFPDCATGTLPGGGQTVGPYAIGRSSVQLYNTREQALAVIEAKKQNHEHCNPVAYWPPRA